MSNSLKYHQKCRDKDYCNASCLTMSIFSAAHVILISLGRSILKYYITLNFSTSLYCLLSLSLLFFLWCFLKTTDSIFALLFTFIYFKCRHPESLPVKDPALVSKPEAVTQCFHSSGELCVCVCVPRPLPNPNPKTSTDCIQGTLSFPVTGACRSVF